jgi:nitroreductase
MPHPAKTDFDINPLLKERYSPRAFLDKPVDSAVIKRIFEAARWSPSCNNDQEWFFIVGAKNKGPDFERIVSILLPGNQVWASKAALLIIACGRTVFSGTTMQNKWYAYDCGQSAAHLTFQAEAEGVSLHQMAGFDAEKTITEFSIPKEFAPLTVIAMGYAGNASQLPENFAQRETAERQRKPQKDFVFGGIWGKTFE